MKEIFKRSCFGFILAYSFFAISCNHKQEDKASDTVISKTKKETDKTTAVEDFYIFFERFSKDSSFQKSRIKFPLKTSYYEDPTESLIIHYVKDSLEVKYIDFTSDDKAMSKETDKFAPKIEKTEKGMVYRRVGYDNGIYVSYFFILSNNSWFLSEILDEST